MSSDSSVRPRVRLLYLLAVLPVITDVLETGALPATPRACVTEIAVGLLIIVLVRKVIADMRAMSLVARSDSLTGLWNRREFNAALEVECARARRAGAGLSLVYIDLDNFKQINDEVGHAAGDTVLKQLATAIGEVIRAQVDRAFRIGGDEFALLLPATPADQAERVLDRIHSRCRTAHTVWIGGRLGISFGIVEYFPTETVEQFVRRGDRAMYHHKSGRSVPITATGSR